MNDQVLAELSDKYESKTLINKPEKVLVNPRMKPDYWLEPLEVWEIGYQNFTLSPIYDIGRMKFENGISLRFPRFIRCRCDKSLNCATTVSDIIEMYERLNSRS